MNINDFFEKLVYNLGLGKMTDRPSRISGGLTHKMYKITTDKSKYIIKLLNPNIMKRPSALENFEKADEYEEILKANNIDAICEKIGRVLSEIHNITLNEDTWKEKAKNINCNITLI